MSIPLPACFLRVSMCKMKYFHFGLVILFFIFSNCNCQDGIDAGPMDPLKLGLIDPLALEVGATYTLMIPLIIFLVGILVIPSVLVILYLFVIPLLIPSTDRVGIPGGRSLQDYQLVKVPLQVATRILKSSDCVRRISCEISASSRSSRDIFSDIKEFVFRLVNSRTKAKPSSVSVARAESEPREYTCERYKCDLRDIVSKSFNSLN